jgi:undecaprenyl diphosphate synthase
MNKTMNNDLPYHIAIIPDGNRRWAKIKGLPSIHGHKRGAHRIYQAIQHLSQLGVPYITVWGFSADNWKRNKNEVLGLFHLLESSADKIMSWAQANNIRLRHLGSLYELPGNLQKLIQEAVTKTEANKGLTLTLAFNYSGRAEIISAVNKRIAENSLIKVDEHTFAKYLYTSNTPDVDLVIRTGGEHRLSNFMLWQTAYSEFYFDSIYWPDFGTEELDKALADYRTRVRRLGGN